jgi:hypothetical protein
MNSLLAALRRLAGRRAGRRPLAGEPDLVLGGRLGDQLEPHVGVLDSAEFRAGPLVDSGPVRLQPDPIDLSGNQIDLAMELGHPERVDDVARLQFQVHRSSHRDVDLVGRRHPCMASVGEVRHFPPPLMADHPDFWRPIRTAGQGKLPHRDQAEDEQSIGSVGGSALFDRKRQVGTSRLRRPKSLARVFIS